MFHFLLKVKEFIHKFLMHLDIENNFMNSNKN